MNKYLEQSVTESASLYKEIDKMSINELLTNINNEDMKVAVAVKDTITQIEKVVEELVKKMKKGGRLFYMGAGTSGRLGILDASEIPPTYGVPHDWVIGLIAGGEKAIRKAVEAAEDNTEQGWKDLEAFKINKNDTVIGIAASGRTPYVIGAVKKAREIGIFTVGISCNPNASLSKEVDVAIVPIVGPEFVTGSSRMKAGTAQKLILNMITTSTMIKLGRVKGNKMVNMQLTNAKLVDRGTRMIVEETGIEYEEAKRLLLLHGSVKEVLESLKK